MTGSIGTELKGVSAKSTELQFFQCQSTYVQEARNEIKIQMSYWLTS
jgi:hypothetical protein